MLGKRQTRSDTIVPCRSGGYTDGAVRIHFNGSSGPTLGVEVELQIIDDEERLGAFSESVDGLLKSLESVPKWLGSHAELLRIRQMMVKGPSCASQRQVYAEAGDYRQVVGSVVDELRQSVPE